MSLESLIITLEAQDNATKSIQRVAAEIERLEKQGANLSKLGGQLTDVGTTMTRNVTAPIVAGLTESARVAAEFESVMFDVNKAFGFDAGSQQAEIAETAIKSLSMELGQLPTEVAAVATEAGKLGVSFDQFEDYSRFVTATGVAFDMTAQDAGESIGVLTNVLGYMDANNRVNMAGLERLGDTINYLADSGATSESAIVGVLQRSGGITKSFGLANEESAALAASFLNLGYPPEVVGTAINGMLPKLQNATQQTSEFQDALAQIGLPAAEFEKLVAQDAAGAIDTLLTAIDASGDTSIISRLFGSGSDAAMLTTAVENLDRFRATMASIDNVEAGSMMETFAKRSQTTEAQLQKLRAATYILRNEIGAALLPAVTSVVQALIPLVSGFATFAEQNPGIMKIAIGIGAVAAAIGPVLMVVGGAIKGIGSLIQVFRVLRVAMLFLQAGGPIANGLGLIKGFFSSAAFAAAALGAILMGVVFGIFAIGSAFTGVQLDFETFLAVIKTSLMELPQNLAQIPAAIGAIFSMLGAIVVNAMAGVRLAFMQMVTNVRTAFTNMRQAAVQGVLGVVEAIRSGAVSAVAAVGSMGQQIIARIRAIIAGARQAGAEIVRAIAAGITSAIGAVTNAIGAVGNAIRSALPGSPVKTGVLQVLNNPATNPGAKIAEMIAAGITAGSPAVSQAMQRIGGQILGGTAEPPVSGPQLPVTGPTASGGGIVLNLSAPITINGIQGAESPDFVEALQRHKDAITQMIKDATRNEARVSYSSS